MVFRLWISLSITAVILINGYQTNRFLEVTMLFTLGVLIGIVLCLFHALWKSR